MELNKQIVSLDLSKRLKELGFKQESLFYWNLWQGEIDDCLYQIWYGEPVKRADGVLPETTYSAYTVAELGEMLPMGSKSLRQVIYKNGKRTKKYEWICWRGNNWSNHEIADTEADARAKMLIYLKENNLI